MKIDGVFLQKKLGSGEISDHMHAEPTLCKRAAVHTLRPSRPGFRQHFVSAFLTHDKVAAWYRREGARRGEADDAGRRIVSLFDCRGRCGRSPLFRVGRYNGIGHATFDDSLLQLLALPSPLILLPLLLLLGRLSPLCFFLFDQLVSCQDRSALPVDFAHDAFVTVEWSAYQRFIVVKANLVREGLSFIVFPPVTCDYTSHPPSMQVGYNTIADGETKSLTRLNVFAAANIFFVIGGYLDCATRSKRNVIRPELTFFAKAKSIKYYALLPACSVWKMDSDGVADAKAKRRHSRRGHVCVAPRGQVGVGAPPRLSRGGSPHSP